VCEPVLSPLWGAIFKHFIINTDIGKNDIVWAGEIKQHLSAFIKTKSNVEFIKGGKVFLVKKATVATQDYRDGFAVLAMDKIRSWLMKHLGGS
jgi:hypothetical protein